MASLARICLKTSIAQGTKAQVARTLSTSVARPESKWTMNDPLEHATGLEKWEMTQMKAGNDDPFFMKARKRGLGTKEEPNIVDAYDTYRMVGCICSEDVTHVKWFWLFEGKPKRCSCGHWFKLVAHEGPDATKLPV